MKKRYRYELEKYKGRSSRYKCPACGKHKSFTRYIDNKTGDYLPEQYGCCDHAIKCSYHLNPYNDGYSKMTWEQEQGKYTSNWKPQLVAPQPKQTSKSELIYIPKNILKETLKPKAYLQNVFIQNLLHHVSFPFDKSDIEKVISQYYLGTICNGYRTGAITFPFIDKSNNIRTIQVKQFDENNHTTGQDFLHSMIEKHHQKKNEPLPDWLVAYKNVELKVSCLFGEHLLNKYPTNPIALVEAPKTAVYGTLYFGFPEQPKNLLWLAVYNLSSLTLDKCKTLQGRKVYLFPDLSKDGKAFQLWSNKAKELTNLIQGTYFHVSNLLEKLASIDLRNEGADIADILIKMNWLTIRPQQIKLPQTNQDTILEKSVDGYISGTGMLYIKTPPLFTKTFSVYNSVNEYNNRTSLPYIIEQDKINIENFKIVFIDIATLTINTE